VEGVLYPTLKQHIPKILGCHTLPLSAVNHYFSLSARLSTQALSGGLCPCRVVAAAYGRWDSDSFSQWSPQNDARQLQNEALDQANTMYYQSIQEMSRQLQEREKDWDNILLHSKQEWDAVDEDLERSEQWMTRGVLQH